MARLDAFAAFTDEPGELTRFYLSEAHRRAAARSSPGARRSRARRASIDAAGNVVARYEGRRAGAPALMIGSHIDTVRDAGRYDGKLGALAALAVVEELAARGERLDVAVEIVAFGDEEGVRFPTTLTGSRALAGAFVGGARPEGRGRRRDARRAQGVRRRSRTVRSIRRGDVAAFVEAAYRAGTGAGGRGPAARHRLGDQRRDAARGRRGRRRRPRRSDADALRRDALAAAAEMMLMIEARARGEAELVATVGRIEGGRAPPTSFPATCSFPSTCAPRTMRAGSLRSRI